MRKNRRYPLYSIKSKTKSLSLLLVSIFLIYLIISFFSITAIRKQNIENISNSVSIYLNQIDLKLNSIEHFVIWSIKNETLLTEIEKADNIGAFANYLNLFRSKVNDFQYSIGSEYQFLLYLDNEDYFSNVSSLLTTDYTAYTKVKDYFYQLLRFDKVTFSSPSWKSTKIGDTYYLYHFYRYNNRALICLISVDDILNPIVKLNLGEEGIVSIETEDGNYLTSTGSMICNSDHPYKGNIFMSNLDFYADDVSLPFSFHIYIDNLTSSERLLLLLSAILTITVTLVLALVYILLSIHTKIEKPIQNFINNLSAINDNDDYLNLQSSRIIELEQANQQFKNLMNQIKKLKINIYEKELEKKRTQLDFLKLQINPHFYLNCLTTIYSMAQTQNYMEIEHMTLSTTRYFRYLFQSRTDYVPLYRELENVNDYLMIQKLRLGDIFEYDFIKEGEIDNIAIPPLVLQTFIENTLKYAFSSDKKLKLYLYCSLVYKNTNKFLRIQISDNGRGYPPDILAALRSNQPITSIDGTRIGIENVIKRLLLLYEDQSTVDFENLVGGGASVTVDLPYKVY